ncbi:serine hydrolase domain-containing protein [Geodermatophilus normandii]|uniref:serine hydrolase domain-containing protein n=1 Tax=Geodermatophilus normandii TaxID=1137989 RepID=UPI001B87A590
MPRALGGLPDDGDAGGSVAVLVDGEPVVDVWGGSADAEGTTPWRRDTTTGVRSVTRTMTARCAPVLAGRGDLDLGAPVGRSPPCGARSGCWCGDCSHTAGLPTGTGRWRTSTTGRRPRPGWPRRGSRGPRPVPLAHPGVPRGRGRPLTTDRTSPRDHTQLRTG